MTLPSISENSGSSDSNVPDREQATALLMAGRHLPEPLIPSAGDRAALFTEASKMYEILGDKKAVQSCRKMLMKLEESKTQPLVVQC